MSYTFIKANGGWWLKITSIDEYMKVNVFDNKKWDEAMEQLGDYKRPHFHFTNDIASLIYDFRCPRTGNSIIQEALNLMEEISENQLKCLEKYGAIYLNKNGGWCFGLEEEEYIQKNDFAFPDITDYKIDIKKFPYGSHYYLYINGKPIKDKFGNRKWNTYKRAKEIADIWIQERQ